MGNHTHLQTNKIKPLVIALSLTLTFFFVEAIGGFLIGSLALIADAAHMLTDVTALAIAIAAIKIGQRAADSVKTYGYYRFEILAAAFNAILLFLVAIYILYEAYQRLNNPPQLYSIGMLVIAIIGLAINLISMSLLKADKDKSLNIKAAYLDVLSDMVGSVGVIVGAIIIYYTGWVWVDSTIGILIGLWLLPRTWVLLKESINILLEGVPAGINLVEVKESLSKVDGVTDIHDLHVWAITSGKISLTAHVVIDPKYECNDVTSKLREILRSKFEITHSTLQDEQKKCLDEDDNCNFF
jgi:cobalt-zinc-cadmium efflux system protein